MIKIKNNLNYLIHNIWVDWSKLTIIDYAKESPPHVEKEERKKKEPSLHVSNFWKVCKVTSYHHLVGSSLSKRFVQQMGVATQWLAQLSPILTHTCDWAFQPLTYCIIIIIILVLASRHPIVFKVNFKDQVIYSWAQTLLPYPHFHSLVK